MKKVIVFDTETTGLPTDWSLANFRHENWPHIVQLCWVAIAIDEEHSKAFIGGTSGGIVKPRIAIPENLETLHGISTAKALQDGRYPEDICREFIFDTIGVQGIVAHNADFDRNVVRAELERQFDVGKSQQAGYFSIHWGNLQFYCTMKQAKMPNGKWPKLAELYRWLFNEDFEGAHTAQADVVATAKCYVKLAGLEIQV